jgi:hypothetical protein
LVQTYQQDRSINLNAAVEQQKLLMRNDPGNFPEFDNPEVEKAVMEYAAQFPPDHLARPGALAECYHRAMGRRYAKERAQQAAQQSAPESEGRSSSSRARDDDSQRGPSRLSDDEARFAGRAGLNDKLFRNLQGPGRMSVDEFLAAKEDAEPKRRRRGA